MTNTRNSSQGNSLELKSDAFTVVPLDFKADAYDRYHEKGYNKAHPLEEENNRISSAPQSPSPSDSSSDLRVSEAEGSMKSSVDEDRVKRV